MSQKITNTRHSNEVHETVAALAADGFTIHPEVVAAMARTDLDAFRACLDQHRKSEPAWKEANYGQYRNDSRIAELANGNYVFENMSVYAVELQLLYPAICTAPEPRVLDVGCGTGWLTAVLADLVAARGGTVHAIDIFARQVEHAERDISTVRPELLKHCTFQVANAWEYGSDRPFDVIAVAAQAERLPPNLVGLLSPKGRLVAPVNRIVPITASDPDRFQPFWLYEAGASPGAPPQHDGRAGPIAVNFLPLLPPS